MTRVHDMGGRYGDGPVVPEPQGIVPFENDWHRRALALTLAAGGLGAWNIDTSRHARECLAPKDYARFSYYEKWIAALADLLVAKGLVTEAELAAGTAEDAPPHPRLFRSEAVTPALAKGSPYVRSGGAPAFAAGDRVRARLPARNALVPGGHTRLPSYAAGQVGTVVLLHGAHVFPDANAHGLGEQPQSLYTVAFGAADLWGAPERAGDEVTLDLWESYLERA
ncbi:nitrile hydratase subunit beta [Albidovulum sediminicola]|uniref:Nitrile hydratase subunit beta n=1 Tax=Albidovulum sediminicola TaxID=2984331 RepID=A0ABT2Z1B5_9RHOB|nr:nitrile hydratase subunit beta [Defluviimonas sp. WL0075]MCV2864888.1 nitrile hydratase subunit beta [Defluviimonas sp. WL0075]